MGKKVAAGREPEAGEAHGRRVERHGPGGLPRRQGRALHVRRRRPAGHEDQVAALVASGARRSSVAVPVSLSSWPAWPAFSAVPGARHGRGLRPGRSAARSPSAGPRREVVLFGTPAAEPHPGATASTARRRGRRRQLRVVEGRGRAGSSPGRGRRRGRPSSTLAPYRGVRGQTRRGPPQRRRASTRFALNDARHRYRLELPAAAQRAGREPAALRVRRSGLARGRSTRRTPTGASSRRRSTAWSSGRPATPACRTSWPATRPRPFAATRPRAACPALEQVGPSVVRFALRLPRRRRAALHARPASARPARRRRGRLVAA